MISERQQENLIKIVKIIFCLIQERSPDLLIEEANKEASFLARSLVELERRRLVFKEMDLFKDDPDPHKQLACIKDHVELAIKEAENLGFMSNLFFSMLDLDKELEILSPEERLVARLSEASDILSLAIDSNPKSKKGRPKQVSKDEFIEAVIQVFEKARGLKYEDIEELPIKESNPIRTTFYNLLDASRFDESFSQSTDAFKRAARRYVKNGRIHQDEMRDTLKQMLQH